MPFARHKPIYLGTFLAVRCKGLYPRPSVEAAGIVPRRYLSGFVMRMFFENNNLLRKLGAGGGYWGNFSSGPASPLKSCQAQNQEGFLDSLIPAVAFDLLMRIPHVLHR
jgi:hypothetical protein